MSSSNFGATIIGEATNKAVTEVAMKLDDSAARLPTVVVAVDGLVADVSGSSLVLNVGKKSGLKVGDVLIVPPGVIHGWADIPDHVDYLSFRPSHGVMKNGWVNPTITSK